MNSKKHLENQYEYPSFFRSAFAIYGSVTPRVLKLVFVFILYAACISFFHDFFPWMSLPVSPFEYAGLVMGLILVFRINAGYDRWWEARKLWGSIVNNSRNLAIACVSYVKNSTPQEAKRLNGYIAALPFLMKNHLRQDQSIDEVRHLVDQDTFKQLSTVDHKPSFLSQQMAVCLEKLTQSEKLGQFAFLQAEQYRATLIDCQGACERILKTPMPYVMAIKSRRFILLFLLMLPFALAQHTMPLNLLVTTLVAYALLSLDQIGIELQNPFSKTNLSHLPIDQICKTIETNVLETLAISKNV